jgi:hypothetical protein
LKDARALIAMKPIYKEKFVQIPGSLVALALSFSSVAVLGQAPSYQTPAAASAPTVIPSLVPYSGTAIAADGKPLTGEAHITLLIFKEEQGGEPLWTESQMTAVDSTGHYKVQLGASSPNGLPSNLFATGEARWLEVQIAGQQPERRVLLASVPYALKAADAATLGGLPASAFALAGSNTAANINSTAITPDASASNVTTTGGTSGYLPVFTGKSTVGDSILYSSATGIGVGDVPNSSAVFDVNGKSIWRGNLNISRTGNATASAGTNSFPISFDTMAYNSSLTADVSPVFYWQAEATGNNTASPGATMNLLYNKNSGTGAETGLYFNPNGTIHFASGQTFPAASSTSGTALSGASSSGIGVEGTSGSGTGVQGISTSSYGVEGTSTTAPGVLGYTAGGTNNTGGVVGQAGATSGFSGIAGVWGDASAHVGVLGTSSQYAGVQGLSSSGPGLQGQSGSGAGVQGTSTSQNGVYGFSSKTSGVHGETQSTSTGDAAVYGGSDSVATGVIGISANGTGVEGLSTNNWAGRFSNSSTAATVYATNTTSSGGSALYAVASGTNALGLYANATASSGTGVLAVGDAYGIDAISNGDVLNTAGVLGVAGYRSGVGGIAGVWGDAAQHVGVIGSSISYSGVYGASTNSFGVQASSANSAGVYGVGGSSLNPVYGAPVGVWGDVTGCCTQQIPVAVLGNATVGVAGRFTNNSSLSTVDIFNYGNGGGIDQNVIFRTLEASTPQGTCGFGGNGDLTCTGQVKSLATTANGARTVETYSMQSPENWMEDFGSGTLRNGVTAVPLEAAFAETVSGDAGYHVFLTPRGDSKGLYVTNVTPTSFEVHESSGGSSSIAFDYRIVAKRRGFETQRMVDVTEAMKAVKARNELQAERSKAVANAGPLNGGSGVETTHRQR